MEGNKNWLHDDLSGEENENSDKCQRNSRDQRPQWTVFWRQSVSNVKGNHATAEGASGKM